ncbi:MAG: hypothetical protein A2469_01125 [Candidatus Magasanikbacteria bacterium RIFOXYC2_FULL_40_16]|uniref:Phosphoenolpyruvate synthase n=2 Tax=Candidatus Magasanikiibacteriota TaxID=1752731 RepID=A0A1F6NHQ9_9BACT|nr:MAG: hypothetical protein A2373_02125 [Candidatus Magasanikbacteria bacterium RIFOXYB1_FULL_40_15]OGH86906.1 MAG: hypothetical protein A2301_02835 [Candidatus Magasanikbacteria bacterium RIFOXYB2_FULL_40_13]OGH90308.1 MAG: hypothetical protein A2469_01125 [Candidatus Magasanikbacteria bacterium RIFOXYC2_FULL_40_16]
MTAKSNNQKRTEKDILWFEEISIKDVPLVGGKNASLGEMYSKLTPKGVSVPNGFALTSTAYWKFLKNTGLEKEIKKAIKGLDVSDLRELVKVGKKVREMILEAKFPEEIEKEIVTCYKKLSGDKSPGIAVAVRSSATAEDLPDASFAGQQETYLNVVGNKQLLKAVKSCVASLFTDRAISYREGHGYDHMNVALSVTVQEMVRSDVGTSGVMFSLDTESGFNGVVLVTASYGLGEYVVKGRVIPDQFYVFKEGLKKGKNAIISRSVGTKDVKLVYKKNGGTVQEKVKLADRNRFCISDKEIVQLSKWAVQIAEHYNKPQDMEWAKDGVTGKLYIVQARPETVKARSSHSVIEEYILKKKGKLLATGIGVGQKIGTGKVRIIEDPRDMNEFKKGEILVTRITDPDWEPIMRIAGAIVTEQGGKTSHAAIVSRELGVPAIVGAENVRKVLKNGQPVTISCSEGDEGHIYDTILPFEVKRTEIKETKKTKTKIMMNVGDPDNAFAMSFLPNDGVGLAREEFIFTNFIRIHPLALVHYNRLKDKSAKRKIANMTRAYKKKTEYCVDKLAEGMGRIAASVYPNDVIIRFSDFKTNEYATMIGGKEFEPKEENPMIGWRGASRYYSKEYKEAFKLECEAVKKVRDDWGLTNVITMVPFCRTPEEGKKVLKTMSDFGLKQGENGLQVYVMCEIPSNVVLADEFAKIFDGFSIGSNDLTQLTLGVDRDSALVSHVYDENDESVKTMIRNVIKVAHKHNKKIGICGQAPSDYPEFAEFLVREGIDSISLNPDTVVSTREKIAYTEKTLGKMGRKTSRKHLGIVALVGIMGAGLISLGAGCVDITGYDKVLESQAKIATVAELREKFNQRVQEINAQLLEEKETEIENNMSKMRESTFAKFSMDYPSTWSVEHWENGVSAKSATTGEYVSVFMQLVDHPVLEADKTVIDLSGVKALFYEVSLPNNDGVVIKVVEVEMEDGEILELNSNSDKFDKILSSFLFEQDSEDALPDRALNHWDVRDKKVCVQMIAYARKDAGSECQAFPTPCDVPQYWEVCDSEDLE